MELTETQLREAGRILASRAGKRSLETMTAQQRSERAKKASVAGVAARLENKRKREGANAG